MSRKNLSRTVIEGGRRYSNRYFRRASHGTARARTRDWLDHISDDLEEADATDPRPLPHVGKQFRDKLGPAQRWLDAQVGRPWNKVYSDLRSRFDARTIAGKHVVDDHMLGMVRRFDDPDHYWSHRTLVIDRHGILRATALYRRSYNKMRKAADAWVAKRFCALTFRGWRWVRMQPKGDRCLVAGYTCSHAKHYTVDQRQYHDFFYVEAGAMTRGELKHLQRLPKEIRDRYVVADPWRR